MYNVKDKGFLCLFVYGFVLFCFAYCRYGGGILAFSVLYCLCLQSNIALFQTVCFVVPPSQFSSYEDLQFRIIFANFHSR